MYRQSTCPIQPHRLIIISISMGPCYFRCQSSALLMISGHCILRMHLRQVFMKVWTFLVFFLVVLHVSDPYGKTELTLELKILYLVWVAIAMALHMFLSWRKATLALPIRVMTSASVPPWLFTMLPSFVNVSSSPFPPCVIGPSFAVFILRSLVEPACIFSPIRSKMFSDVFSCRCWCLQEMIARSSAKSMSSNYFHIVH